MHCFWLQYQYWHSAISVAGLTVICRRSKWIHFLRVIKQGQIQKPLSNHSWCSSPLISVLVNFSFLPSWPWTLPVHSASLEVWDVFQGFPNVLLKTTSIGTLHFFSCTGWIVTCINCLAASQVTELHYKAPYRLIPIWAQLAFIIYDRKAQGLTVSSSGSLLWIDFNPERTCFCVPNLPVRPLPYNPAPLITSHNTLLRLSCTTMPSSYLSTGLTSCHHSLCVFV